MPAVQTLTVDAGEDGARLDRWFRRRWPHVNHVALNKLLRSGQIRVDGGRAKVDTRLPAGAQVRVPPLPDAPEPNAPPERLSGPDYALARSLVLYEDDDVLALNKPSGLAVQGGTKTVRHVDRLLSAWGEGARRPRLVHRLDRDTSGVLILGKSPASAAALAAAFARRRAKKTYWALVAGEVDPPRGEIELPLLKSGVGDRELVRPARLDEPGAEAADTEYVTLAAANGASWMALRPHTGRTHQLRAHMLAVGHGILGDRKYHDDASTALTAGLKLQLHARRLSLPHPSGRELTLQAPVSPELQAGLARFGFAEAQAPDEPFDTRRSRR